MLNAPDPIDDTGTDLIVCVYLEKSGSNVDLTAPVLSGVTNRAWSPWLDSGVGRPSAWVGDYTAPGSAKALTYPQASGNGLGAQIRLAR